MYRSAHYVLFVNYEDYFSAIEQQVAELGDKTGYFFSGYDCDSLALEPVSGFIDAILPTFEKLPQAVLELRTKSTQIRGLLAREPLDNVVAAFSLSPQNIIDAAEAKTPNLQKRLDAMVKLQDKGWRLGLRFDPLIYHENYRQSYAKLFQQVFARIDADQLHSVSLGGFRMPQGFFQNMVQLHPREALFAGPLEEQDGMVAYQRELESQMMDECSESLLTYIKKEQFFPCH
jgi:spore photoproduct lyase